MTQKIYFPFAILQMVLNVFRDDDGTNNFAIISGYIVERVKKYRILKEKRKILLKMILKVKVQQNARKLSDKIKVIKKVVSRSVWNSLLKKGVKVLFTTLVLFIGIVFFIFNLKYYIIECEHKMSKSDTALKMMN